ncbi:MAG: hypothetical protein DHS20C18_02500 [Saprospiraceae bacterium]|nr:MAG: hypothetical protein DHS20C18_02500 [Saprospiraceae bacterium]
MQSSGSKPLAGVKLSAFGSSPVYSNSSGQFEITFSNKKPGSTISLIIEKEDYEVINDKELDNCVLRERADDLVIVVMARQGERSKQALAYYNIIIENANTTFNKELKDINTRLDALDEDDQDRQVLRQQIEDLQKEKESLMNRAEDLAKQLAIVDLDQASSLAKTAYEKFQSGDIKAALAVLDDDALDKSLAEAKNEKANLEERLLKVDSALQQSIENYMIKARFCITDRQYKAAYKNYLKAVEADSTHVSNLWELASFCDELNQQQRAIRFFQQALNNTTSVANKASLLMNLGNQFTHNNSYEKAETAYLQSLEIYQRLAKENPQRYEPDVASTQMNLGVMYRNLNAYEKTEQAYLQSLEIYQRLAKENPQRYEPDVARTQMNLGVMYRNLNAYKKAEQAYLQSLETYQRLAKENPQRFDIDLCRTLLNIGYFKKALLEKRLDLRFQKEGQEIIQQVKVILGGYEDTLPIIKAFKSHYHTLDTYFNGITEEALIIQQAINKVVPYEEKNQTEKNPALVVTNQEMVISLLETTLKDYPNNQQLLTRTANAYGNMAWYYLFNRQFAEATQAAQRGLGLDETQEWINTNLALGLLYQGKMEDATALYSRLKDLPYNNATYKSTFLEDLVALEKEGITCAGVEEIRRLLGE